MSHVEGLETRRLLSVSLSGGVLSVIGTAYADTITVSRSALFGEIGQIVVNDNGAVSSFFESAITQVQVDALGGNDSVVAYDAMPRAMLVYGGAGNDTLRGGGGSDSVYGQDGNDTLDGRSGADLLCGGAGSDTADFAAYSTNLNVSLDNIWNDTGTGGTDNVWFDVEKVAGGSGADYISGSESANTLLGGGGSDTLYGLGGNDTLDGGVPGALNYAPNTGDDYVNGGEGNDVLQASDYGNCTLNGAGGDDVLYGWLGNDLLAGAAGNDSLYGYSGNDTLYGLTGVDLLYGQDGDDQLFGEADSDVLYGGNGNDQVDGGPAADSVYGEDGDDILRGNDGNDTLSGGDDRDDLYGGAGFDSLTGGAGDDGLFGGGDTDTLTGGTGEDRFLDYTWRISSIRYWQDETPDRDGDDARLGFEDGDVETLDFAGQAGEFTYEAGAWTEAEVESLDVGLKALHQATGNKRLLERPNGGKILFVRQGSLISGTGSFSAAAWNSGGTIHFTGGTVSRWTLLHEVGHNWQTAYRTSDWRDLSGWTNSDQSDDPDYVQGTDAGGNWWHLASAQFVSTYAMTNPNEDFAETFKMYIANLAGWQGATSVAAKATFMGELVASLV